MEDSEPLYKMHDMMKLPEGSSFSVGAIRGIQHQRTTQQGRYVLRALDGKTAEVPENELEEIGTSEAPLQYDEIVEIEIEDKKYAYLNGKRGVVSGISVNDETKEWFFGVTLQTGEVISCSHEEMHIIGRFLSQSVKDKRRHRSLTIQVDADSGEGILINGDPSVNLHKFTPYPVDLEDL